MGKQRLIFLIFLWSVLTTSARTLYVDQEATGNADGTSWADAYPDLQVAINEAEDGEDIWVAEGVYRRTEELNPEAVYRLSGDISLYGGFQRDETSPNDRDLDKYRTVISGDLAGNDEGDAGSPGRFADNAHHIFKVEIGDILIDGFSFQRAHSKSEIAGAIISNTASLRVSNCVFSNNTSEAVRNGGAISVWGQSLEVDNCEFWNNKGYSAGAIWCLGAPFGQTGKSATITASIFHDNESRSVGGAIGCVNNFELSVVNCLFYDNRAISGGAINVSPHVDLDLFHCTFYGNTASLNGGAISFWPGGYDGPSMESALLDATALSPHVKFRDITNCIFWGNLAPVGLNIHVRENDGLPLLTSCCVENGYQGENIIEGSPGFIDETYRDLGLSAGSRCINKGVVISGIPARDIAGVLRDGNPDIGAYERPLPHIEILSDGQVVPSLGAPVVSPSLTHMGIVTIGHGFVDREFICSNIGTGGLQFGTNPVIVGRDDSSSFSIVQQPSVSTLPPGGSTAFTVRFSPIEKPGAHSAIITVQNTDEHDFLTEQSVQISGKAIELYQPGGGGDCGCQMGERHQDPVMLLLLFFFSILGTVRHLPKWRGGN